jgi:hypothetical protein
VAVGVEEGGVVEHLAASVGAAAAVGSVGSDPVHAAAIHPQHVHAVQATSLPAWKSRGKRMGMGT